MQISLATLLETLRDAECVLSVHQGILTTPEGHTLDIEQTLQELARATDSTSQDFVDHVARLNIWAYDKNDGSPYQECKEPSDGYLDSHCCLMELIEQARTLHASQTILLSTSPASTQQGEGAQ